MSAVTVEELKNLVKEIFDKKVICEALDLELTAHNKELARLEQKCIEYLKDLNLDTFDSPFGKVTPVESASFTVPKTPKEREDFFQYLKSENLFDGMVTVNYQTLNGWAKQWYAAAKERGDLTASIPGIGAPTIAYRLHKTKKSR